MLKKLSALLLLWAWMTAAFAVDANQASAQELTQIKGIGEATAERIIEEREKAAFADWEDFIERVKGVGEKKAKSLSDAGLTVGGQSLEGQATGD